MTNTILKNIYVIYDSKARIYHTPFYMDNDDVALRAMTDVLLKGESEIARFPADFTLFRIGTFNPDIAEILTESTNVSICRFNEITLPETN